MNTTSALYGGLSDNFSGVLNPTLYTRMTRVFGRVEITKPREPFVVSAMTWANSQGEDMIISHGEQYYVNCPFCRDTRMRLYVNHTFGQMTDTGRIRYIARCYNEDCIKNEENRDKLKTLLTGFINVPNRGRMAIRPLAAAWAPPRTTEKPCLPEECIPLTELHAMIPNHIAISYMLGERRYTWDMLRQYNVLYCFRSQRWPQATNRIIFPCYVDGELYGWQARYIGKPLHPRTAKYYNLPGMQRESYFYNWDVARNAPMLVITEGIPAAHFLGGAAVASLGKTISPAQFNLLQLFRNKPIVVWYDDDAQDKLSYLQAAFIQRGLSFVNIPVVDKDKDPADWGYTESWRIIRHYCNAAGVAI
jgi:hypothetical protein